MALRRRQRGIAPAAVASTALLLVACGASTEVSQSPPTPTADVRPNACDLVSDSVVESALTPAASAAVPSPSPGAVKHVYTVRSLSEGGTHTVGQCTWTDSAGAEVIALVIPNTQITKLADYTAGATRAGDAYIQEGADRGFVSIQKGPDVFAITLIVDVDTSVRTAHLADLARAASGAAIPSITAAPSAAGSASPSAATASGPGQQVSGQTASAKVKESDQLQFSPTSVSIKAGQVLEWDNTGQIAHNVTFDDYPDISSDTMNGGDSYQVKFTKAGTYQYHCTFHPGMEGSVTVG
jgi:plastocyanin